MNERGESRTSPLLFTLNRPAVFPREPSDRRLPSSQANKAKEVKRKKEEVRKVEGRRGDHHHHEFSPK